MALARQFGEVDYDADCEHPSPHDADAVAIVTDPREIGGAGIALCPYHLALWNDIQDGLVESDSVRHLIPDDALLHLTDIPATLERDHNLFERVGIDHTGHAHYVWAHDNGFIVKILDASLTVQDTYAYRSGHGIEAWLTHVSNKRGWMQLGDDYSAVVRDSKK